jgi:hypothetical protein
MAHLDHRKEVYRLSFITDQSSPSLLVQGVEWKRKQGAWLAYAVSTEKANYYVRCHGPHSREQHSRRREASRARADASAHEEVGGGGSRGRRRKKVEPAPSSDSNQRRPPCRSTNSRLR